MKKPVMSVCAALMSVSLAGGVYAASASDSGGSSMRMPKAPENAKKPDMSKVGYAIGYKFGMGLKSQNVDVTQSDITSGLKAGLGGNKPKYSQKEMQNVMQQFQQYMMAQRAKQQQSQMRSGGQQMQQHGSGGHPDAQKLRQQMHKQQQQ